jgi:hypothetical protein
MHPRKLAVALAMSLSCTSYGGETNDCGHALFCLPSVSLRTEAVPEVLPNKSTAIEKPVYSVSVSSGENEGIQNEWDFHSRILRSDQFYLTQAKASPESGFGRFIDGIFTPEVFRLGKASVSCPITTAIKRKNPLCLLSGLAAGEEPTGGLSLIYKILAVTW